MSKGKRRSYGKNMRNGKSFVGWTRQGGIYGAGAMRPEQNTVLVKGTVDRADVILGRK
jgi:hypothetical protein